MEQKLSITTASWVRAIAVIIVTYAAYRVSNLILAVLAAIIIASAIEPLARSAKNQRIPRLPVVILIYLFAALVFAGLFYFLLVPIVGDLSNFIKTLTLYSNSVADGGLLTQMFQSQNIFGGENTSTIFKEMSSYLNNATNFLSTQGVFSSLSSIFGGVTNFILILVLSFYLAVQEDGIAKFLKIITPVQHENYIVNLWRRSQVKIGRWMQGQIIASVAVAILAYLGLLIVGVPHALLLAVSVGIFDLIPIFGPILAAIPAIFIAFISGGSTTALIVALVYLIVQQIESNVIYPLVHKKIVGVPPMVSILSVVIGWELAGFLGVVIAVPIAAAVMEVFADFEEREKGMSDSSTMLTTSKKSFYITTTLPYVNAEPHIGFAMEIIRADVIARSKSSTHEVFFNTGTDEHGQKIWEKAREAGKDTQEYVDEYAEKFKSLIPLCGINEDIHFIRTTDEKHVKAAQEFWKRCNEAGDIYKKLYKVKYCVGCELEKTDSELEDGKCQIHPSYELEIREEENYFFRFSKYQKPLLDFYAKNPNFVIPDFRFNEIKSFVERGLEDFSISRLKSKMPWGVSVPGDEDHVMYVWFDALVSYISTLGWFTPSKVEGPNLFEQFWVNGSPTQYAGKDNLRQQSAMWQAMLMSAGLPNSNQIVINGFINSGGQKMSKSLGNVISPVGIVEKYGTEAMRYFVCRELSSFEDSDFTWERMKDSYNGNLANGLGNLVSRIMQLAETNLDKPVEIAEWEDMSEFFAILDKFEIKEATDYVWNKIAELDKLIQEKKPWESKDKEVISNLVTSLYSIARLINPFMPETSKKIKELISSNKKPEAPIFPRINA